MTYEEFPAYLHADANRLFSIVCAPSDDLHDTGVVLLTGGNYTRSHRNRMWVRAARELAERGFASIRLDYHGVGESTGTGEIDLERPFASDVTAAVDFLQSVTGVEHVALVATCFGGRSAIPAAARHPSVSSATVFPLPIMMPRRQRASPTLRTKSRQWMRGRAWGSRLLRNPVVKAIRHQASPQQGGRGQVSQDFKRDLVNFLGRGGGRVHFVYGELSESLGDIRRCIKELEPHLKAPAFERIELEVIPHTVLTGFHSLDDQDICVAHTVASVERLAGAERDLSGKRS